MSYNKKQKQEYFMRHEFQAKLPVITIILVLLNVGIWLFMEITGDTQDVRFMMAYGAAYAPAITEGGEQWRLFTSMFLHFGADHLINNMLILGLMGLRLENTLGSIRFLILYLASGLCGNFLSFYQELATEDFAVSAGASGAVFGVIGGLIAWAVFHKGRVEGLTTRGLFGMAVLSLYYGFSTAGVDNWGHIGGILGGFLISSIFAICSKVVDFKKRKQYTIS